MTDRLLGQQASFSRRTALLQLGALALAAPAWAAQRPQEVCRGGQPAGSATAKTEEAARKVPQTVEDHLALVERYRAQAAAYRKEADVHRETLAGYRRRVAAFPNKSGHEFGWFTELRQRCEGYIRRLEALADEAERFAEFHRMRARELQGE